MFYVNVNFHFSGIKAKCCSSQGTWRLSAWDFYKTVRLLQTGSHTLHPSSSILIFFFVTKLSWLPYCCWWQFQPSSHVDVRTLWSLYAVLSHPGWSVGFWIAFLSLRLNAGIKQLKEKRFTQDHTIGGFRPWPPDSCCLCAWHACQSRQKQMTEVT